MLRHLFVGAWGQWHDQKFGNLFAIIFHASKIRFVQIFRQNATAAKRSVLVLHPCCRIAAVPQFFGPEKELSLASLWRTPGVNIS